MIILYIIKNCAFINYNQVLYYIILDRYIVIFQFRLKYIKLGDAI